jgi:hypothetical protein
LDDDLAELEVEEIDFFSNPVPVINGLFLWLDFLILIWYFLTVFYFLFFIVFNIILY